MPGVLCFSLASAPHSELSERVSIESYASKSYPSRSNTNSLFLGQKGESHSSFSSWNNAPRESVKPQPASVLLIQDVEASVGNPPVPLLCNMIERKDAGAIHIQIPQ